MYYNYVESKLNASLTTYGGMARAALLAFKAAQDALADFCDCKDLQPDEAAFCHWHQMEDLDYEALIDENGYAKPLSLPALADLGL